LHPGRAVAARSRLQARPGRQVWSLTRCACQLAEAGRQMPPVVSLAA
jgi:hypothetical protein